MESKKKEKEKTQNPVKKASFISKMTFAWTLPIFIKGTKKILSTEDLYEPLNSHKSDILGDKLDYAWDIEVERCKNKEGKKPSLLRAGLKVFWWQITLIGIIEFVEEFFVRLLQPIFLAGLITDFSKESSENNIFDAYLYAIGIVMCSLIQVFMKHPCFFYQTHVGMQMRVAASSIIYRKVLRLTKNALERSSIGQVVNLLSNDVARFEYAVTFLHYLFIGPLEVIVITIILYREIGISILFGVCFMILFVPLQMYLGKLNSKLRLKTAIRTDKRVRLMNEIIQGIQVIKQYTWEYAFAKIVEESRIKEMKAIRYVSYIRAVLMSFIFFTTRTSIFLSLVGYVLLGNYLDARTAFLVTAYFNILRLPMTSFFAQALTKLAETLISAKRIEKFMLLPEIKELRKAIPTKDPRSTPIEISNASAKWDTDQQEFTIQNINLKVKPGTLNAIVGYVGSSKSSLLQLILKELPLEIGTVNVDGTISYASQEPFLFSGTIRQNILFGQTLDIERYKTITRICALEYDFRQFPNRDFTIIGERGTTLSGGQKARVNLARAIYRDAEIYLLDDPLSAVDPHVSKHLFDKCIKKWLNGRTVLLVTNQLEYLEKVDNVIYLEHGKILSVGTYKELLQLGLDFTKLVEKDDDYQIRIRERSRTNSRSVGSLVRQKSCDSSLGDESEDSNNNNNRDFIDIDERQSTGSIGLNIYAKYFKACGGSKMLLFVSLICFASQFFASSADYYWSYWVAKQKSIAETPQETFNQTYLNIWNEFIDDPYFDVYLFTVITILTIIVTFWRSISLVNACVKGSKNLHNAMFKKITRAPMLFFNTNPSGRILNRFSKDIGQIDEILPTIWIDLVQHFLTIFGVIVVTSIVNPYFLIPIILIAVLFYYLRIYYLKTSSSLKRLEATTRSPIYSHLSASLNGLSTIRAFNAEKILIQEFNSYQDKHSSAFYLFMATNRGFGFFLDFICVFYIAIVTFSFFLMYDNGGNIGLAITQAINFRVQFAVRQSAELENTMTAVERVVEYEELDSEPDLKSTSDKKPKASWPENGEIKYEKLSLKYYNDERAEKVLIDISFEVKRNEKIGIVGRTGAGKSSLISALFRLFYNEGLIEIDKLDTSDIGLHDLRSKISIIPQEPVLFSGTLRYNLDPFEEYTDVKLWNALEEVQLKEMVQQLPSGLLSHISEGGSNFSVGQRQLICLCRAILRENKILVMDEATANVDPQTDALIQKTIRSKFANCTVLTIAHRLNTIMDSDKIIVMDEGRCLEFGSPYELLTTDNGPKIFQSMARQVGDVYYENFLKIAAKALEK
uniref:CSON002942 protein n=1 Tax=Culicoides sonorensis TaxID=179676 RepID=A0A336K3I0_CULSO